MRAPLVSVVVPAFDLGRFLPAALDSALGQDWPAEALEVIVVDDGSTDDTPRVLAAYADRVTVIRQPNRGLVAAVDRGLAAARGTYVGLLDADDEWPADRLRRQVAHLEAHPEAGMVHGDMELIDTEGRVTAPSFEATRHEPPTTGRVLGRLLAGNFVSGGACLLRASLLPALTPIPADAAYPDWWLAANVAAVAEIHHLPGIHNRYRFHGANMGLGSGAAQLGGILRREIPWRRWMLRHLAADPAVTTADLLRAWRTWEHGLLAAAADAGGGSRALLAPDDDGAADAAQGAALLACDPERAVRVLLRALAADPFDGAARLDLEAAFAAARDHGAPAPAPPWCALPARGAVTLAWAGELAADPALLAAYGAHVGDDDDATLVVLTAGEDDLAELVAVVAAAGLDGDGAADLLAVDAPRTLPAARLLAARAAAVLAADASAPFATLPRHAALAHAVR